MLGLWLQNLAFYSLQIAGVAAAGALLLRLLQIRIPTIRLMCWQALIAACIALPAIQPWLTAKTNGNVQISMGPAMAAGAAAGSRGMAFPVVGIILLLVGAGAAVRFGILGLGLWQLRQYRRNSTFVPGAFDELQRRLLTVHSLVGISQSYVTRAVVEGGPGVRSAQRMISRRIVTLLGQA